MAFFKINKDNKKPLNSVGKHINICIFADFPYFRRSDRNINISVSSRRIKLLCVRAMD